MVVKEEHLEITSGNMNNNNTFNNCLFLDCDGVLNYGLFYEERYKQLTKYNDIPFYKTVKKYLRKLLKSKELSRLDYYKSQMCPMRMQLLNEFCAETNSAVVLSASMRSGWTVEDLQKIFNYCGATFTIIGKTGHSEERIRGVEIYSWLKDNCKTWFGVDYYDFSRYIIFDDDGDFLIWQQSNFFQCDNYVGLTPTITYRAKRYLNSLR
jgi:hypothetical protein